MNQSLEKDKSQISLIEKSISLLSSFEKNIDPPNPIYSDISCILPSLDLHLFSVLMHLTLILFHISVIFPLDPILSLHLMHLTLF